MRRWNFLAAVTMVGLLMACGPKKPFAQEQAVDGRWSMAGDSSRESTVAMNTRAGAPAPQQQPAQRPAPRPSPSGAVEEQASGSRLQAAAKTTVLRCGSLLDVKSGQVRRNVEIVVVGNKIESVGGDEGARSEASALQPEMIDLSNMTCLPGLIDTHTHVLLQGDITAEDYDVQLLKQSNPYRAIVGAATAGKALNYGFTTLRDLETEGAGYSDVDIKKAINNGIVPGPRMQVATRALDVTGAYPLQGYNWELHDVPHGVQFCDGADECRKAVREQISHGADWIKVYSDRSYYLEGNVLKDVPTFTLEELRAIVDEAHRQRRKVASHATAMYGVHNSVEAGVDSIEHGDYIAPEDLKTMEAKGIWFVPTLFVGEYVAEGRAKAGAPVWVEMIEGGGGDVPAGAAGRSEDRVRHGCGRVRLEHQSGEGVRAAGEVRADAGAGDPVGDGGRGGADGNAGCGNDRAGKAGGHCGGGGRSASGRHGAGEGAVRDEGWSGGEAIED